MNTVFFLISIVISSTNITVEEHGRYTNLVECFDARDSVLIEHETYTSSEMAEKGLQVVCVAKAGE